MNGADPVENGVNGTEDAEMEEEATSSDAKAKSGKDQDGDEEMTVVVPPPKSPKPPTSSDKDKDGDLVMGAAEGASAEETMNGNVDPRDKAITGKLASSVDLAHGRANCLFSDIKNNFGLLERAVSLFDPRFTLRVLRSISSMRKHLTADVLAQVVSETYAKSSPVAQSLLGAIQHDKSDKMDLDMNNRASSAKPSSPSREPLPEIGVYLSILCQIHLCDKKAFKEGAKFSEGLVERLRTMNRRTLDSLAARVYFYYSLFYEQIAPLPPSPVASIISVRQPLLAALRTAVLRKDQDVQATVTTLLLRNYLSTSHIIQADLLISHTQFPPTASNNQIARYLYYLGRIRAIQLSYTEAHEHLIGATRKSPTSHTASGFYQASHKLLVVVELLMGDIPDRALFRQPSLESSLQPYLQLVQAVSVGDLDGFLTLVQTYSKAFRHDGTYTLILRLRQNVIKTGLRMMSLSYARISLRDICLRLGLGSEESAEYIVAKAIRDGVIEASIDHEKGFMKSKEVGDVYATSQPGEAFHERITACLSLHDESVKVRFQCHPNETLLILIGYAFPHEPTPP